MLYISQLFETHQLETLLKEYPVGLEVISFSIGSVLDDLDKSLIHYQKEFEKIIDKPMIFHGPFLDLNPGSCDTRIIELVQERFEHCMQASNLFKASAIVAHTGFMPKTYPKKYWIQNTIAFWKNFIQKNKYDGEIYLENVLDSDPYILKELIEGINNKQMGICLDIGHVNTYSKIPLNQWIEVLGHSIKHVHLHNNNSVNDEHKSLLKGTIKMHDVMEHLMIHSNPKTFTLEMSNEEDLIESIEWIIKEKYLEMESK